LTGSAWNGRRMPETVMDRLLSSDGNQ